MPATPAPRIATVLPAPDCFGRSSGAAFAGGGLRKSQAASASYTAAAPPRPATALRSFRRVIAIVLSPFALASPKGERPTRTLYVAAPAPSLARLFNAGRARRRGG